MENNRERSVNFSAEECEVQISLVLRHKDVIENKKSDNILWKEKISAWKSIEAEFNACSKSNHFRSHRTLKVKYDGFKRSVRKKSALIRADLYKTGGGPCTAVPLDSTEIKVMDLISLSAQGMSTIFDSDADFLSDKQGTEEPPTLSEPTTAPQTVEMDIEVLSLPSTSALDAVNLKTPEDSPSVGADSKKQWDSWSVPQLRTPKHTALRKGGKVTDARRDLIYLQKKILLEEYEEKKKEWAFRQQERIIIMEIHTTKLKLLLKKIND